MLNEFTYKDNDINEIVSSCMSNVSMVGIIGSIYFKDGADPVKNVHIERIQGMYCTITKTCSCNVYPLEPHFYIAKLGYAGVYLFFSYFCSET